MPARKITRQDMRDAAEKYKNWGKWGPNDEIGTLNYTSAEDIVAATRLVKKGKVISLALNFDHLGPQGAKSKYPSMGRTNPIHTMLRTGTDAYSGVLDKRGIRAADDMVTMPLQCGTQWDGLGHVFYDQIHARLVHQARRRVVVGGQADDSLAAQLAVEDEGNSHLAHGLGFQVHGGTSQRFSISKLRFQNYHQ